MLSKRAFLAGSGAVLLPGSFRAPALAEPAPFVLALEAVPVQLGTQAAATGTLRLASPGNTSIPRLARGRQSSIAVRNAIREPVSFDWQGLRGGFALDDPARRALQTVAPSGVRTVSVTPRDAGTSLLRASPSPAHAAERGAATVLVTGEDAPPAVDRDVVVMLADWLLAADGTPRFGSVAPEDASIRIVMVNGQAAPLAMTAPPRARLRLRFVNASPQRVMVVACEGGRPVIVAIDGQPSERFAPVRNAFPIGPGARYDLFLDMPETSGELVRFHLKPLGPPGPTEPEGDVVVLRSEGDPLPAKPPVAALPANPALPAEIPLESAKRADLVLAGTPGTASAGPRGWTVNGVPGSQANSPVLSVRAGAAVTLGLINTSAIVVPLRVGGQAVRLLHAKDDGWEPYWRDTLLLPPQSRNHVAFVADVPGRWPIDSGFDDLTLAGLSCWFTVSSS